MIDMINKRKGFDLSMSKKAIVIAAVDVLSICIAFFAALWLRFDFQFNAIQSEFLHTYCAVILPWCAICIGNGVFRPRLSLHISLLTFE